MPGNETVNVERKILIGKAKEEEIGIKASLPSFLSMQQIVLITMNLLRNDKKINERMKHNHY